MCVYVCVCVWVIVKFSYYYAKNLMRLNYNMNELRNPFIHIYTVTYLNTRIYIHTYIEYKDVTKKALEHLWNIKLTICVRTHTYAYICK